MSDYVVHLDRGRNHSTTACPSAGTACDRIDERRGEGWILGSILRNDWPIDEKALRLDALHEPRPH